MQAAPNTVFDNYKDGKLESRRYYGHTGKPRLDIDMTSHGNPKQHPVVPHYHGWDDLNGRDYSHDNELTQGMRIANADVLKGR